MGLAAPRSAARPAALLHPRRARPGPPLWRPAWPSTPPPAARSAPPPAAAPAASPVGRVCLATLAADDGSCVIIDLRCAARRCDAGQWQELSGSQPSGSGSIQNSLVHVDTWSAASKCSGLTHLVGRVLHQPVHELAVHDERLPQREVQAQLLRCGVVRRRVSRQQHHLQGESSCTYETQPAGHCSIIAVCSGAPYSTPTSH